MKRSRMILKALVLLVVTFGFGAVRADMGSVRVEEVGQGSMKINWSDPSVDHRYASDAPIFTVTWVPSGSYPYVLPPAGEEKQSQTVTGFDKKPFVISNLLPDTAYTVTVEAFAEKRSAYGEWINAKDRLVGELRQRTQAAEPAAVLRVEQTSADAVTVELAKPKSVSYQVIRLAYKEKWSDVELNLNAMQPELPEAWRTPNAVHGAYEETSDAAEPVIRATFTKLLPATRYEIVAYGFNLGQSAGVKLASAMARTGGFAPISTIAECLAVDHRDVLETYANTVRSCFGEGRLIDRIAPHNEDLYRIRPLLASDEGDNLDEDLTALHYVIAKQMGSFEEWQQEASAGPCKTLEGFLADVSSSTFRRVQDELDSDPTVFQRGDADRNGVLEISDAIRTLKFLFTGGTEMHCYDAADANDDGEVEIGDPIFLLSYLYGGGADPKAPYGACGPDPTPDPIDCDEYSGCPR